MDVNCRRLPHAVLTEPASRSRDQSGPACGPLTTGPRGPTRPVADSDDPAQERHHHGTTEEGCLHRFGQRHMSSSVRETLVARQGLTGHYEPLRLPTSPRHGNGGPSPVERSATTDRSRNRASHVPAESFGARGPLSPRRAPPRPLCVALPVESQASPLPAGWPLSPCVTRPIRLHQTTRTLSHHS